MENVLDLEMPELLATDSGGEFQLPPVGTWQGVIYSVIDIGTQTGEYQGKEITGRKIRLGFEFADDEDEIHTTHKEFTLSFSSKSKLKKFIDDLNGGETKMTNEEAKGFNIFSLLGRECTMNVIRKKSTKGTDYADIGGLSPRIKKIALHERKNSNMWLYITEKHFNTEVFEKLPNFVKEKIESSPEYKKLYGIVDIETQEKEIEEMVTKGKSIAEVEASTEAMRHPTLQTTAPAVTQDEVDAVFAGGVAGTADDFK